MKHIHFHPSPWRAPHPPHREDISAVAGAVMWVVLTIAIWGTALAVIRSLSGY